MYNYQRVLDVDDKTDVKEAQHRILQGGQPKYHSLLLQQDVKLDLPTTIKFSR